MAKQLVGTAKFQVPGGQATPAPPVGTSFGKFGINLGQFVQQFNERTREAGGMPIPVVVNVYSDRSFDFACKSPPAAALLKQAAGIAKGSGVPNKDKVGKVNKEQLDKIVKLKKADLNASRSRPCPSHDRRHGPQHGNRCRRLMSEIGTLSR